MIVSREVLNRCTRQGRRSREGYAAGLCLAVLFGLVGCNGLPSNSQLASEMPKGAPQTYMAPVVGNGTGVAGNLESFTFDNTANTFQQATSQIKQGNQSQINTSGNVVSLKRNLLELDTLYTFPVGQGGPSSGITGTTYDPKHPLTGSWAVQLPDHTGGLVQLVSPSSRNQPVTPLVAAVCPSSMTPQTYQFLTIPNAVLIPASDTSLTTAAQMWNPAFETAYGSVDIGGTGGSVTLANTRQFAFPSNGGPGIPPGTSFAVSVGGVCAPTLYGETISVPGPLTIISPGNNESVSASATIGISSSGLLVEDNGTTLSAGSLYANGLGYQNALGAGTGAIGLLKPKSPVDTGSLIGAQYNGFIFGTGNTVGSTSNFSSKVASFGFSSVPTACADVAAATNTLIYGGDFPDSASLKNDPSDPAIQSAGGFGNCNYAIDLGSQDGANNGFYPAATVYVGKAFSGNSTGKPYSFPAIAIAGTLAGKNAIFLLGVDMIGSPNQAVGIYLLQSN